LDILSRSQDKPSPKERKGNPENKPVIIDIAAFRGSCSFGGDAVHTEAPPHFG